ncbi:putative superfamily III holin-X [Lentzea atacamensis]|uniref:Superfamily III holin-X n=2 Tax=Lentzea atacamensis TaxID=531938 RepID=A0A316HY27_9PSEU|nr:putative superfamily III holin-X [Lentzea atacamensis]RAS65752.1 putative superfamily III holin-X [Lentzea atacamensis]
MAQISCGYLTCMNTDTSTAQLVNQLSEQVSRLARDEIRLAVAELKDKGKHAGVGAGMFGAAGVFAWWGGLSVVAGIILALSLVLPAWASALIVAAVLFVIAGVAALMGRSQVRQATPPVPRQAMDNVQEDIATIKERAHR